MEGEEEMNLEQHPLSDFMYALCKEYDKSLELHRDWSLIEDVDQLNAIDQEFTEVLEAYRIDDVKGEHGELNELVQVANCCGKRFNILKKRK